MRSISKEDLAKLPIRRYEGPISLVITLEELARAREDIRQERVVGMDTETRPSFSKGVSHLPCLVQIATARAVYLLQLSRMDVFPALVEVLAKPDVLKVGIGLAYDLSQLKLVFPFTVENVLDLGIVARRAGFGQTGVRNLAAMTLGFRIPKGNRTSNWAVPRLSPAQITYAATDAWICRELYFRFESLGLLGATSARSAAGA